ncbi:MAG: hypothetical protein AB8H80_02385 [Planctomycetota bacterium]
MPDPAIPAERSTFAELAVRIAIAVATGWLLYEASCWLVPPIANVSGFGTDWQAMSADPFSFPGRLSHRILGPLLAWLMGQGGEGWLPFCGWLHVFMLAAVCFAALHLRAKPIDAILVTTLVAIAAPVQMYKLHWSGYTDPLCYGLFALSIVTARFPYVFWGLFLLNLGNHELAGFLAPWLYYLRRREDGRWRLDLVLFGAACALYLAYYLYVRSLAQQQFSIDYFVGHPLFPGGSFIVYNLASVHWVCAFGPMLALLGWHQHRKAAGSERWHLWLVLLGIAVIFAIAFDWARHSNLILLPLLVAAVRFLEGGGWRSRTVVAALIGASLLVFWLQPPWSPSAVPTNLFLDGTPEWRAANNPEGLPLGFLVKNEIVLFGPAQGGGLNVSFASLGTVLERWLPTVWPLLLMLHGLGAAIWLFGWLLARFRSLSPPSAP